MTKRPSWIPLCDREPGTCRRIGKLTGREFNVCDLISQYQGLAVQAHEIARSLRMTEATASRFLWTAEQVGLVRRVVIDSCHDKAAKYGAVERVTSGWLLTPIGTRELADALAAIDQRIEEAVA